MIKQTIVDNITTTQLEVFRTEENTIRLYLSDSENQDDYQSVQYIDLDINDTEFLIKQLNRLTKHIQYIKSMN